jgi:hypothetical protein
MMEADGEIVYAGRVFFLQPAMMWRYAKGSESKNTDQRPSPKIGLAVLCRRNRSCQHRT